MSIGTKITIGSLLGLVLLVGGITMYIISSVWTAKDFEIGVKTEFKAMKSAWAMTEQGFRTQGFTVEKYGEDFIKSLSANAERYANDKGGMMKWVQEAKSQLSDKAYLKLMDYVEKMYAKRESKQLSKDSVAQSYEKFLGTTSKGWIAGKYDYPTPEVKVIMDKVIQTETTAKVMDTGMEAPVTNPFK